IAEQRAAIEVLRVPLEAPDLHEAVSYHRCYLQRMRSAGTAAVYVVAITELATSVEAEAAALAPEIGSTPYETRLELAGGMPAVVLTTPDRARAQHLPETIPGPPHPLLAIPPSPPLPPHRLLA